MWASSFATEGFSATLIALIAGIVYLSIYLSILSYPILLFARDRASRKEAGAALSHEAPGAAPAIGRADGRVGDTYWYVRYGQRPTNNAFVVRNQPSSRQSTKDKGAPVWCEAGTAGVQQ